MSLSKKILVKSVRMGSAMIEGQLVYGDPFYGSSIVKELNGIFDSIDSALDVGKFSLSLLREHFEKRRSDGA